MKKTNPGSTNPKGMPLKATLLLAVALCFTACKKAESNESLLQSGSAPLSRSNTSTTFALAGQISFKVLSFNVRHHDDNDPQSITERRTNIRQIIIDNAPDVFGVQEFSDDSFETWFRGQMATLGYGEYYDTAITGTPKAIFFKTNRFSLQGSGTFRLGTSPIINTGTWVTLLDNQTSKKYFISNSHWQYDSQSVRIQNSAALVDAVKRYNTEGLPEIIFGDFNAEPGTTEIINLKNGLGLVDALGDSEGGKTFHGWTATGTKKLDWLMSDRSMAFTSFKVITTSYAGYWPSDHWPIIATFIPAIFGDAHADVNGISASPNTKFNFADVNGDGKKDKIYWNPTFDSGMPRVFLSNGNGTFISPAITHAAGASTLASTKYYYADVDGDGKEDEILWNPSLNSGKTMVYLATGNGTFSGTAINNTQGTSAGTSTQFNFADVNGDGRADKIYWNATFDSGRTRVYLATSGGYFSGTVVAGAEGASTTTGTTFYYADVNADNRADKIIWHPTLNSGKTMVYLSDGDGTFTANTSFSNSGASSISDSTVFYFADINGDARADKIYWRPDLYLGKLKVYYAQTSNVFDGPVYSLRGTSQSENTSFYFGDINGDGQADQIRWNYGESNGELKNYFAN